MAGVSRSTSQTAVLGECIACSALLGLRPPCPLLTAVSGSVVAPSYMTSKTDASHLFFQHNREPNLGSLFLGIREIERRLA
jgi:hypothetical protein